jgi:hypothetical protein
MTPVEALQQKLGVPKTGHWDGATYGAITSYQSGHHLDGAGHPDPQTLSALGYYGPSDLFTKNWSDYLAGGSKPGTFGRDLRATIDQVPRWAWATLAVGFSAFAYLAYRTDRKREGK